MAIVWEQLVFGKLVQSPGGPIVPGLGYRVTGISSGYPPELVSRSHPHQTGLNTSDLFNWQKFPWNAGGGFIARPVLESGRPAILAGRIRGRSERGEGEAGRPYVQAHYAVTSVAQWNPAAIALLPSLLDANPMMAEDKSMAELRLDDGMTRGWFDRPLESNWIESIFELLTAVASGVSFNVQDPEASLDDFLDRCALCACAVPRTLAWRISIGAGLAEMRNDVSLGLGQFAPPAGFRRVGPNLHGSELPELKAGTIYVEWLRLHASDVRTRGDLRRRIGDLLPAFADEFSVSAEMNAKDAAEKISAEVSELFLLDRLHTWLATGIGEKPGSGFRKHRKEALAAVLSRLRPHGLELLSDYVSPAWADIFAELAPGESEAARSTGILSRLGGLNSEFPRPNDIEEFASDSLPVGFVQRVEETLDRGLFQNGLGGDWTGYVCGGFRQVPWLQQWFERNSDQWFWFAVDRGKVRHDLELLLALRGTNGNAIASFEILRCRPQVPESAESAEALVNSATKLRRTENLGWLFEHLIERGRVAAAIVLAETSWGRGVALESAKVLFALEGDDCRHRADLALALHRELDASSSEPHGTAMCGLLVATSCMLDISDRLKGILASRLGNPLAGILVGVAAESSASSSPDGAREIAARACILAPDLTGRLWQHLSHPDHASASLELFLLELLLHPNFPLSRVSEKIRFVADLLRGWPGELPSSPLSQTEIQLVRHLLKDQKNLIVKALAGARRPAQLANGLQLVGKMSAVRPVNPNLVVDLIEARIDRSPLVQRLLEVLSEWDWHLEPLWRILFLPWAEIYDTTESPAVKERWDSGVSRLAAGSSLAPDEKALLDSLSVSHFLALAAFGLDVPRDDRFSDIRRMMSEMRRFSTPALEALAHFFRRSDAILWVCHVADILVARVSMSPSETAHLLMALSRSKWMPRFTREDLSPLVRATRKTLNMLSREQYDMFKCRLEGLDRRQVDPYS
jgi:hypothetical protein